MNIKSKKNNKINKYFVNPDASITDVFKQMSKVASKCLVVVNQKKSFLGTITDGDIRKNIIKKNDLNSKISKIYNKNPIFYIDKKFTTEELEHTFITKRTDLIPILSKSKKIIDIFTWNIIFDKKKQFIKSEHSIDVIIMAGGKGERLKPFTNILPKPLVPINDQAIISHIIKKFITQGFQNFYITVNYKKEILKAYLGQYTYSKNINYINEKKPLGTAGGLRLLGDVSENIIVSNCDTIIDIDYNDLVKFHEEKKNDLTIVAVNNEISIPFGVLKSNANGRVFKIDEKPKINNLINIGFYVISKKMLKFIPLNKNYGFNEFISLLIEKQFKVGYFPVSDFTWVDVGQWDHYKKTL